MNTSFRSKSCAIVCTLVWNRCVIKPKKKKKKKKKKKEAASVFVVSVSWCGTECAGRKQAPGAARADSVVCRSVCSRDKTGSCRDGGSWGRAPFTHTRHVFVEKLQKFQFLQGAAKAGAFSRTVDCFVLFCFVYLFVCLID